MFKYGLKARPLGADFILQSSEFTRLQDDIDDMERARGVRHGIIIRSTPYSEDFIKQHELIDLQERADQANIDIINKTIKYLIKKNIEHKYITKSFYTQINMTENEFYDFCQSFGMEDEFMYLEHIRDIYNITTGGVQ